LECLMHASYSREQWQAFSTVLLWHHRINRAMLRWVEFYYDSITFLEPSPTMGMSWPHGKACGSFGWQGATAAGQIAHTDDVSPSQKYVCRVAF
jgi:hypothetical protein